MNSIPIGHDDTETGEYSKILNVYITRSPGRSLGISIVGGNEEALSKGIIGIFVRTIVEGSPADCENGLKVNDRILEVRNQLFLWKNTMLILFIYLQNFVAFDRQIPTTKNETPHNEFYS